MTKNIVVFGGGAFGTAMAVVASRNKHNVTILVRSQEQADSINNKHINNQVFKETVLPDNIAASTNAESSLRNVDLIIHAIPVQASLNFLKKLQDHIPKTVPIMSTSKGIHAETAELMCGVIDNALGEDQYSAFLSGPSFAKEMIAGLPTAVLIGSKNQEVAENIANMIGNQIFRPYLTNDVIGLELGGALKNPLAIGAGIIEGLGFGSNTLAGFLTRGLHQMTELSVKMGGKKETLGGLSGMGDLMLTAYGGLSRNKTVGLRLGKGEKLEEILESIGQVAEGVSTAGVVVRLADKYGLELSIFRVIDKFIKGEVDHEEGIRYLMNRPFQKEHAN